MNDLHISWPEHYPEQLADIGSIIAEGISRAGVERERIPGVVFEITEHIRREFGGCAFYLARGKRYELSQKQERIWREFSGTNYQHLARKHELSEVQIRNIVKRAKERDRLLRQGVLFDAPEDQN